MADAAPVVLDSGTYDILRQRLAGHADELRARLDRLNAARKDAFGTIDTQVLVSRRITTEHNCIPRDIIALGDRFLFGYNVQFGLKSSIAPSDVFAAYEYKDRDFRQLPLDMIANDEFERNFTDLYKYYKNTTFKRFALIGPHLFMAFRVGKQVGDVKTFKWTRQADRLVYIDNRSDHEYRYPPQQEFEWKRAHRSHHREGVHPHVSIDDRVFVETIGGDLTIKVEDNTASGAGIYSEPVQHRDQTLDDAEILYALVGHLILLKVRPYQEQSFRYFIFNEKLKTVHRVDAIENACVLLPDQQGLIFANGYYVHTGELKLFDHSPQDMLFERRVASPNGEDHLFVFYNREKGLYILLSYNIITQRVENPILCNGFTLFANGEMVLFRAEQEPMRHHVAQVWQTPYTGPDYVLPGRGHSKLESIGNKDIVRAMAECEEIIRLARREDPYAQLYQDLVRYTTDVLDSYFWLGDEATENLAAALRPIREAASAAIDEFEKVTRVRRHTNETIGAASARIDALLRTITLTVFTRIDQFVSLLAELRKLRGEIIGLRELRFADKPRIDEMEKVVAERTDALSTQTLDFLTGEEALKPYADAVRDREARVPTLQKATEAKALEEELGADAAQLDLLIDIVSNLKIDDAAQSAAIIDRISGVYTIVNQVRAQIRNKRKDLLGTEAVAEFGAQVKLLQQSVANFLDVADTPEKCDEFANKLLVQIEGLEGRFADFEEFVVQLAEKRAEVQNAFETRKVGIIEGRNRRALALMAAADRILKGIAHRAGGMKSVDEINSYFAGDLMIEKVRETTRQLMELGDSAKAEDLATRLKAIKEESVRQLKDRQDLYEDGENIIKFGRHRFAVNTQPLDLTIVRREGELYLHLTGTRFFDRISDPQLDASRGVWDMEVISESPRVYRGEYLAWRVYTDHRTEATVPDADLAALVHRVSGGRYQEGYTKGVHDADATRILAALVRLDTSAGALRYGADVRVAAYLGWRLMADTARKDRLARRLDSLGAVLRAFPSPQTASAVREELTAALADSLRHLRMDDAPIADAALYLFEQLTTGGDFVFSEEAENLATAFRVALTGGLIQGEFDASIRRLDGDAAAQVEIARAWLGAFAPDAPAHLVLEAAARLLYGADTDSHVESAETSTTVEGMLGTHPLIDGGRYTLHLPDFIARLRHHDRTVAPAYETYGRVRREILEKARSEFRLEEFKPKVLTTFVRNQLIDKVYLPSIGDNLAKQLGTAGDTKRTDRFGMLLLISPPGYGKTTLMEYVCSRLGLVFVKVNGPSIGHRVVSLDPREAPNAAAREELEKLNLSFEMGDNVMIYLDDIQHLDAEFLQKFISLCDAQRKIEGVFRGQGRTYDFRGRKVCVVMAGNPYTESGQKFRIPDMLANRADTYNLGDIIGGSQEAFELSYIENSLTNNPVLAPLATRARNDVYAMIRMATTGDREGLEFEGSYSAEELNEYVNVLRKLRAIQAVILRVNEEYIRSAAQADDYRTEPPFKLQGSYRNMGRLASKVVPMMNEGEIRQLIMDHYEGESQTLTTGAEANLLKFKEMTGWITPEEQARWDDIRQTFRRNNRVRSLGGEDASAKLIAQVADFTEGVASIREVLAQKLDGLARREPEVKPIPVSVEANLSEDSIESLRAIFSNVRGNLSVGDKKGAKEPPPDK